MNALGILAAVALAQPYVTAIQGRARDGGIAWPVVTAAGSTMLPAPASMGAFGSQLVSEENVEVSLAFPYNVNSEIVSFRSDGGTFRSVRPFVELNGDAGAIVMESHDILRYLPGQGVNVRFTAVYSPCVAGQTQEVGAGTDSDMLGFGCCPSCGLDGGASFAALRRSGGVDNWTPQASWNVDRRASHNPTLGSPYAVDYQWLGFGQIRWHVENPATGLFEVVHALRYANTSASTSLLNPNLPLRAMATQGASLRVPSMSLLRQGPNNRAGVRQSTSNRRDAATTPVLLLAVRGNATFAGSENQTRWLPDLLSWNHAGTAGQDVVLRLVVDTKPTGGAWVDTATATSVTAVNSAATATVGGRVVASFQLEGGTANTVDLRPLNIRIRPNSVLGITAQSASGTPAVGVSLSWVEEF